MASCVSPRVSFKIFQEFGCTEDDLGALGSWDEPPLFEGLLGCIDCGFDVRFTGFLEYSNYVASVGGIAVFERFAG